MKYKPLLLKSALAGLAALACSTAFSASIIFVSFHPDDNTPTANAAAAGFTRTWHRPPTRDELKGLVDEHVKEEIDRSRQAYDQRIPRNVSARTDYFKEEMIRTLAGGDSTALGPGLAL